MLGRAEMEKLPSLEQRLVADRVSQMRSSVSRLLSFSFLTFPLRQGLYSAHIVYFRLNTPSE